MKIIDKYLQERVSAGTPGKVNAPEFIYQIIYGELPSGGLRGRGAEHPERIINGVGIDKAIPTKPIKMLNRIDEIEVRSSCQGQDESRPTFLIIRLPESGESKIEQFCENMSSFPNTFCDYDVGNEGQYRIGIAALLWPEKDKAQFKEWWYQLPTKIEKSLSNI